MMYIFCDLCGVIIEGMVTNIGDSINVVLACSDCVAKIS